MIFCGWLLATGLHIWRPCGGMGLNHMATQHSSCNSHSVTAAHKASHFWIKTRKVLIASFLHDADFLCYFIGYWRVRTCAGSGLLGRNVWGFRRTADPAQEGSMLLGEREGGRRQELQDEDTERHKEVAWWDAGAVELVVHRVMSRLSDPINSMEQS